MTLWMVRPGRHGEHELRFLDDKRIYATWEGLALDLSNLTREELSLALESTYPGGPRGRTTTYTAQLWTFVHDMRVGDLVAVPLKSQPVIRLAEISGEYEFDGQAADPYYHRRAVQWLRTDLARTKFDKDILLSLGAQMTICRVRAEDAEARVRSMLAPGTNASRQEIDGAEDAEATSSIDLERVSRDEIAKRVIARFKGHGLARLIDEILKLQGYVTLLSPEGPDKGVDILAAPGELGFGTPTICVQVKSGNDPADAPTLQQLQGAMQDVKAEKGLFVSWGGFKSSVEKQRRERFFSIRLWDQDDVIDQILMYYDRLPDEIKVEVPLKHIWTLAMEDA